MYPSLLACQTCGAPLGRETAGAAVLVPGDHAFRCQACGNGPDGPRGLGLSGEALAFLRAAAITRPASLDALPVAAAALRELEHVHGMLIRLHLEKDLRSARVLRDMRQGE